MCGIAGVVNKHRKPVDRDLLERMVALIRHRGPDEAGFYTDVEAGLGHARLSIIDVSCGQQPMSTLDGNLWITFNGEIFNYLELQEELIAKGHKFATRSDTEVLLHMYQEYGADCVKKLNGQWAFGIWDTKNRTLFLSRDRLGVRPVVYTQAGDSFLFASEVKALLANPSVERRVNLKALDQLFTFWFPLPPHTFFEGIFELPPGHSLTWKDGEIKVDCHWELDYAPDPIGRRTEEDYAEELWSLLIDAVRLRLRSDVPVGTYLSGGLDSSVTTAIVKRFTERHLRSFSVTFDDPEFDESPYQNEVVNYLGTEHQTIRCSYSDIGNIFPDVIWHTEKPVLRTAPAPLFMLSQLVRDAGFKVVVTGEGSDEMLGGYDIFKEAKIRAFWGAMSDSRLRPLLLRRLYPYLANMQNQSDAYLKAFFHVSPAELENPFFSHLPRWELTSKLKTFFSADARAQMDAMKPMDDLAARLPHNFGKWDRFLQAQYLETMYLLPGYILSSQGDRVGMAHSVEIRLPFLDFRVVAFAAKLPPTLKMKVLNEKYLLKKCANNFIPDSVRTRHKQPYRAPEGKSFFSEKLDYVEELLSPRALADSGVFDPAAVSMLVKKFQAGRAIGIKDNMAMTGILSTQLVIDQFVTNFRRRTGKESNADVTARLNAVRG
jgi:asparagine synthase (glutamine-hydrolysing)